MSAQDTHSGTGFCPECGFQKGNARFCPNCGKEQTASATYAENAQPTESQTGRATGQVQQEVASGWNIHVMSRRVTAGLLDIVGIIILSSILGVILAAILGISANDDAAFAVSWFFIIVFTLVDFVFLQGHTGQSVGKKVLDIKVIQESNGDAPGIGPAFIRTLLLVVEGPLFSYVPAIIAVLFSKKNRRLGDMAANTLVVRG